MTENFINQILAATQGGLPWLVLLCIVLACILIPLAFKDDAGDSTEGYPDDQQ